MIAPPLTITEPEIAELLRRTSAAVLGLQREAKLEGLL